MTRDDVLEAYRPVRASIQQILGRATESGLEEGIESALLEVAPWAEPDEIDDETMMMLMDVALYEPDDDGNVAFRRFADASAAMFTTDERALVEKMRSAWFSLFRVDQPHESGGVWLEDVLDGNRRLWLLDETLEQSTKPNDILGMRLFEAGPFHAGFGIAVECSDEVLGLCLAAQVRRVPLALSSSLAALVYSDSLASDVLSDEDDLEAMTDSELIDTLSTVLAKASPSLIEHRVPLKKPKSKKGGRRKGRK